MRRSVRDAIVGFTVIGGIVGFAATAMWMRGVRLGSSHWTVTASFSDAGGLAERSPVTYRGILVGSVRSVKVTPQAVVAELEINKGDLKLSLPVTTGIPVRLPAETGIPVPPEFGIRRNRNLNNKQGAGSTRNCESSSNSPLVSCICWH